MSKISIINKSDIEKADRFDAEYFKPEYLEIERKLEKIGCKRFRDNFEIICGGKTPKNYLINGSYRIVRSGDLKGDLINDDILLRTDDEKNFFQILKEDILISSIGFGSIGKVAINLGDEKLGTVSEVSILRNSKANPFYLSVYLQSKYGQKEIEKQITGATGQLHLLPSKVSLISFPTLPQSFQLAIENIVKNAHQKQNKAKENYSQAENILLQELDLFDFQPKNQLTFTTTKKEIDEAQRFDAEYFQPKYDDIIKKIENYKGGVDVVGNIVSWKKGIEVGSQEYTEDGKDFVRVSDVSKFEIESTSKKISNKLFQTIKQDFQPQKGEILFTKDGTIGISYIVREDIQAILSSAFLRLTLKENYKHLDRECLSLILNSMFCKLQAEKLSGGALINHLKPSDFEQIKIPLISQPIQKKISKLIEESHQLRKESKSSLEKSKKMVEDEIERLANIMG